MKKKISALLLSVILATTAVFSNTIVFAQESTTTSAVEKQLEIGDKLYGYEVIAKGKYSDINADTITFRHSYSGATVVCILNNDKELSFNIGYNTPQTDESDRNHVFEHAILGGSSKYPSNNAFFDVINKTYNTNANASTGVLNTNYKIASMSQPQLEKMIDVYLSCMVAPSIMENENYFKREALNYTLEDKDSPIQMGGTVFTEDTGYVSSMEFNALNAIQDSLYPNEIASNMVGRAVENYKLLTYDHVKELYNMCYHFDNSLITLYGDLDYRSILKFMDDEYLSKSPKNNTDLSKYASPKSKEQFVNKVVYTPANEGDSVKDASEIVYAMDLSELSMEDILKYNFLSAFLSDDSSILGNKLMEAGIYNSFNCSVGLDNQKPFIAFELFDANPEIKDEFYSIVKASLKEVAENGIGDKYNSILKSIAISKALSSEGTNIGIDLSNTLTIYWTLTGKTDFFDVNSNVIEALKNDQNQSTIKNCAKWLLEPKNSALLAVVPKPGEVEKIDEERNQYLQSLKASMSDKEIADMVTATKEYDEWNNNGISNNNVAIKPEQLPEPEKLPQVDVTKNENVTSYSVALNKDIGSFGVSLDASAVKQEDLYYLYLFTSFLSNIDTKNYTKDELSDLTNEYLNRLSFSLSDNIKAGEDKDSAILNASWICSSNDYEKSINILLDILESSYFSNIEAITNYLDSIIPNLDIARANSDLNTVLIKSRAGYGNAYAFDQYFREKSLYDFAVAVNNKLKTDTAYQKEFTEKMQEIQKMVVHKENITTTTITNEKAIDICKKINNEKLNALPSYNGEQAKYSFDKLAKKTAVIVEATNQISCALSLADEDLKGEYLPYIAMISDLYTLPTFRFNNGVYSAESKFSKKLNDIYYYSFTYFDPNAGKTIELYEDAVNKARTMDITQEQLDNYIVSAYGNIVFPTGEFNRAKQAIDYAKNGIAENNIDELTKGIRNCKLSDMAAAMDYIQKLIDNEYTVTFGSESAIRADENSFDTVIDARVK